MSKYRALLLDVMGTLIVPRRSVSAVYAEIGARYGVTRSRDEIRAKMYEAFYGRYPLGGQRFEGDGQLFWRYVLTHATGSEENEYFREVYAYYSSAEAWRVLDGAAELCADVKAGGVKVGLIENYDCRLRGLLLDLKLLHQVDHLVVSAEVGIEKPSEKIYEIAIAELLGNPAELDCGDQREAEALGQGVLHVGDDALLDCWAAEQVGCEVMLWGAEIRDYSALTAKVLGH
jgi:REG-2-like HAD superfamily hydrolase